MEVNKVRLEYKNYLSSKDWLIKKSELINTYKELGWDVSCIVCGSTNYLAVHHMNYKHIGDEIRRDGEDKGIDIHFMCRDCHKNWHFKNGFKESWLKLSLSNI